jgi:GINS complex subunit 4
MIEGPEGGRAVFVRCLGGAVKARGLGDEFEGDLGGEEDEDEGGVGGAVMRRGEVWVVRWEGVRRAVERGDVELL